MLVTGGTGGLGGVVARHLVVVMVCEFGVGWPSWFGAPGGVEFEEELVGLGARVGWWRVTCLIVEAEGLLDRFLGSSRCVVSCIRRGCLMMV